MRHRAHNTDMAPAMSATVAVAARLIHLSARCGAGAGRVTSRTSGHAALARRTGSGSPSIRMRFAWRSVWRSMLVTCGYLGQPERCASHMRHAANDSVWRLTGSERSAGWLSSTVPFAGSPPGTATGSGTTNRGRRRRIVRSGSRRSAWPSMQHGRVAGAVDYPSLRVQ